MNAIPFRSAVTTQGRNAAGARALWRATGMTDQDFEKPIIAIANSYTQFVPGHVHLKDVGDIVADAIREAGGVPREFNTIAVDDGIAMGHAGMLYSLPSREVISDAVEYMVNGHAADALVCISNCDKITPGMLNAAMRLNIPVVFVSGGPMEAGKTVAVDGVVQAPTDLITAISASASDKVDAQALLEVESAACPTCGSCSGMFTANSMNCLTEALGLSLPGNGSTLATHAKRRDLFTKAGASLGEQVAPLGVSRQGGTIARQGQAKRLGQTVHRVGGEHAGAGATRRAGGGLNFQQRLRVDFVGRRGGDGGNEIRRSLYDTINCHRFASLHRPAGDEHHRNVQAHGGVQHAGRDLVAVGDAHQRIGGVAVDHVFDGVRNDLAAGQRVEHACVSHSDAVVDGDGVELAGYAAGFADGVCDDVSHVLQVHVARYKLRVRVRDGDDGLLEVLVRHACRTPQGAGAGGVAALGGDGGSEGDGVHAVFGSLLVVRILGVYIVCVYILGV